MTHNMYLLAQSTSRPLLLLLVATSTSRGAARKSYCITSLEVVCRCYNPAMTTLQEALGFEVSTANPLQRLMQRIASSRPGAAVLSRTLEPLDKLVYRASRGRTTLAGALAGPPVVTLTTTGARSGKRRSATLLGVPMHGTVAVIGTNWGGKATPGWVYNLEADSRAEFTYRAATVAVVARRPDDAEFEQVFESAAVIYPGYARYRERIDNRTIRIFILDLA